MFNHVLLRGLPRGTLLFSASPLSHTWLTFHLLLVALTSLSLPFSRGQRPADSETAVRDKIAQHLEHAEDLAEFYANSFRVNGDQEPHTVFECIESILVRPQTVQL